jgi:PAS domain S-box-containing protein
LLHLVGELVMGDHMSTPLRVLIVEDSEDDARLALREMAANGFAPSSELVQTREALIRALDSQEWDLIIADYTVPGFGGLEALELVRARGLDLPFIVVSGAMGEETAVEVMRAGANDYVMKDRRTRLGPAIARELHEAVSRRERRQADQALETSERTLRTILDSAQDGIVVVDAETRTFVVANEAMCRMLGYRPEELVGRSIQDVHPTEALAEIEEAFASNMGGETPLTLGLPMKRKDGTVFYADLSSRPTELDGRTRMVAIFRDITERKQAEEERDLLEQQLFQAQKLEALGTLAGGIAHDFNNALTGIIGLTELALEDMDPNSKVYETLAEVPALGRSAADLVSSLMVFSRRGTNERRPLPLLPLMKEMGNVLSRTLPETITVRRLWPEQVPLVEADPTQVQQVIMNLATNARDAMPDGGELTLEILEATLDDAYCRLHPDCTPGDYVCLSVRDTGTGISPEVQARMFEPFFTTKETGEGTGLGLASANKIVKNHGGYIRVTSELGTGTQFDVYLPVSAGQAASTRDSGQEQTSGGGETLLLVDDAPNVLRTAQRMLESFGYTVLTARDGEEGLEVFRSNRNRIALVLTDIAMPKMTGKRLCAEILRTDPTTRLLLASGHGSDGDLEELRALGVQDFVQKPFGLAGLGRAVREALDSVPAL